MLTFFSLSPSLFNKAKMQAFNLKLHLPPGVVMVPLATKVISQLEVQSTDFLMLLFFSFTLKLKKKVLFLRTGNSRIISGNININTSICMWI